MERKSHPLRGYLYIASAALFWGVAATLGRAAFTGRLFSSSLQDVDPLILSQCRTSFSFLALLPALLLFRGPRRIALPRADLGRTLLLGLLGVVPSNYFYYLAIQRTNVATAIIVQYTAPVWVLLYLAARGVQRVNWQRGIAVALAVAGIAIMIGLGPARLRLDYLGIGAALLAAFSFSFYNIAGHGILGRYDHWIVLFYTTLSASLVWLVINPPWRIAAAHYSAAEWIFLLVFALLSVLVPFSFYFAGLGHLEPTRAIIVSCLEPVFSIVIAAFALGELLSPLQTVGIILVLAAIVLVQRPDRKSAALVVEPID